MKIPGTVRQRTRFLSADWPMQRLQLCIAIGLMQKRTAALCKRSGVIRKRQPEVMQMPGRARENRQANRET